MHRAFSFKRTLALSAALISVLVLAGSTSHKVALAQVHLSVLSSSTFRDGSGYTHIIGEVMNNASSAQSGVTVSAFGYDSGDKLVASSLAPSFIDTLRPGEKSPFDIIMGDASVTTFANYTFDTYSDPASVKPAELVMQIGNHSINVDGDYVLSGSITNQGSKNATLVKVGAAFYDGTGSIVAATYNLVNGTDILPGKTAPFQFVVPNGAAIASTSINAQSQEYSLINNQLGGGYKQTVFHLVSSPLEFTDLLSNNTATDRGTGITINIPVSNSGTSATSFIVVFQERDAQGYTQGIQTRQVTLNAGEKQNISISWQPPTSGLYTVQSFVIDSYSLPSLLATPQSNTLAFAGK